MTTNRSALVVLSGGQDSSMCLHWAKSVFSEVHAITFVYGQRHVREISAAKAIAKIVGVASHEVLDLGDQILKGTSPLTDQTQPLELYDSFQQMDAVIGDRIEKTFVPMRNALFLTLAANRAVVLGCDAIVTGVCQADNANYPDCRASFIQAQEAAINEALGRGNQLVICAPLMNMSKKSSVKWAHDSGWYTALAFTHTAYDGQFPPTGKDHASVLRAHGFLEAGLPDPLVVRCWSNGLMDLPNTPNYADVTLCSVIADNIRAMAVEHFSADGSGSDE